MNKEIKKWFSLNLGDKKQSNCGCSGSNCNEDAVESKKDGIAQVFDVDMSRRQAFKKITAGLMIGTGALSSNLIRAHATVRPINNVYVWGRNLEKAQAICDQLKNEKFNCHVLKTIADKISEVDIVSCATLSNTPLVLGNNLRAGQHIDLVGAYKKDMREADNAVISSASVFVDTFGGLHESGDIAIPLDEGILTKELIKGDLYALCSEKSNGRNDNKEITVFKSVGHALEDLVAAGYYYNKFNDLMLES